MSHSAGPGSGCGGGRFGADVARCRQCVAELEFQWGSFAFYKVTTLVYYERLFFFVCLSAETRSGYGRGRCGADAARHRQYAAQYQ